MQNENIDQLLKVKLFPFRFRRECSNFHFLKKHVVTNRKKNIFTKCKKCIFLHFSDVYFFKKRSKFRVLKPTDPFFDFCEKMVLLFSVIKKTPKKCLLMFTFSLLFGSKKVQYIKVSKIFYLKNRPDQNIFFKFSKKL